MRKFRCYKKERLNFKNYLTKFGLECGDEYTLEFLEINSVNNIVLNVNKEIADKYSVDNEYEFNI